MAPQLSRLERERIVAMWGAGLRVKQIENETGITRKTILYWIRRNEETGGDLTPHHRQLYQRATTANEDGAIVAAHTANPFRSTALIAADYNAPLPPKTWSGVLEATDKYIACPQHNEEIDRSMIKEDCLIANIFVPDTVETNLPVLVYIHGGLYQTGYASEIKGIGLASKGVISVHINYRVGVHGFLCLGTKLAPGNAGLKDMIAGIKWVKNNIAQFGGNPDDITVGGSSAGSSAVELLILSPLSTGLFNKASCESGNIIVPKVIIKEPLKPATKLAHEHGISSSDLKSLEDFFRSFTFENLLLKYNESFLPCIETHDLAEVEKFLIERPMDTLKNGNYEKVKLLTGFTQFDGLLTHPYYNASLIESNVTQFILENLDYFIDDSKKREVAEKFADLYFSSGATLEGYIDFKTDSLFSYPLYASALLHARNGADVFMYYYTYNSSVNLPPDRHIAAGRPGHVVQTLYIFDYNKVSVYSELNEQDQIIREQLRNIYVNFVAHGHPIPQLPSFWWPVADAGPFYVNLNAYFVMSEFPIKHRLQVWEDLFGLEFFD